MLTGGDSDGGVEDVHDEAEKFGLLHLGGTVHEIVLALDALADAEHVDRERSKQAGGGRVGALNSHSHADQSARHGTQMQAPSTRILTHVHTWTRRAAGQHSTGAQRGYPRYASGRRGRRRLKGYCRSAVGRKAATTAYRLLRRWDSSGRY